MHQLMQLKYPDTYGKTLQCSPSVLVKEYCEVATDYRSQLDFVRTDQAEIDRVIKFAPPTTQQVSEDTTATEYRKQQSRERMLERIRV